MGYAILGLCMFAAMAAAEHFSIYGNAPGIEKDWLEARRKKILLSIGQADTDSLPAVHLHFAETRSEFDSLTGKAIPEWGGAAADLRSSRIVVASGIRRKASTPVEQVVTHELTHILLHQTGGGQFLPRWFHEGLAQIMAGQVSWNQHMEISKAIWGNQLLSLAEIERVNHFHSVKARLAYAQSRQAVGFLIGLYGWEFIPELIASTKEMHGFYPGLHSLLHISREELDAMLEKDLRKRYGWIFFFGDTWLLWLSAVALLAVALVARALRNRRILQRWDQEDKGPSPGGNSPLPTPMRTGPEEREKE